jgi:hypothetical protein
MIAAALGAGVFVVPPAWAERPMAVDDAGTLDPGGAKLEAGWSRDHKERGLDAAAGYGPVQNVELEISLARAQDRDPDPSARLRAVGAALKWVPIQPETGLSAGLKLSYDQTRVDPRDGSARETERARALTGLLSWTFESGQRAHLNLGHEWIRVAGDDESGNTWGVGFEQPLTGALTLTAEVFGVEDGAPDRQVGLRYEISEGLALSAAVGRGSDRNIANAGIAWEF